MSPTLRLGLVLLATVAVAAAQSFTERMNSRFERQPPLVGESLPEAIGHTADGKPFALSADRGNMTVLVFGCLT